MGFVPTYSIPRGFVHKFFSVLTYEEVLGKRSTRGNNSLTSVYVTHGGVFLVTQTYEEVFWRGVVHWGKYNLLRSSMVILTYKEVFDSV